MTTIECFRIACEHNENDACTRDKITIVAVEFEEVWGDDRISAFAAACVDAKLGGI